MEYSLGRLGSFGGTEAVAKMEYCKFVHMFETLKAEIDKNNAGGGKPPARFR